MPVGLSHRGITNSLQVRVVGAQPAIEQNSLWAVLPLRADVADCFAIGRTRKQVVLSYSGMPFPSAARGADPRSRTQFACDEGNRVIGRGKLIFSGLYIYAFSLR